MPKPKRMVDRAAANDAAGFAKADLLAVWPEWKCVMTQQTGRGYVVTVPLEYRIVDAHHILGRHRGDKRYSSVYNSAPLARIIHDRAPLTDPLLTLWLLKSAKKAVEWALANGLYTLQDHDAAFLEIAREWEYKHFPLGA